MTILDNVILQLNIRRGKYHLELQTDSSPCIVICIHRQYNDYLRNAVMTE